MATPINCWKCLARPGMTTVQLSSSVARIGPTASFSSTASRLAMPPQMKKQGKEKGNKQTLKIKKKAIPKQTGKPPASGERKAMRKRIVLSNTNAIEVKEIKELNPEFVAQMLKEPAEADAAIVGKVVGLPPKTVDSLRAIEAFKTTQGWGLFRKPCLLVRKEAFALTSSLVSAQADKSTYKLVIDGIKGTGKSMMLLQAQATALARGWVVLNVPEAQEIVNAVNDYAPIPGSNPPLWTQPTYTANWLEKIVRANPILETLKVTQQHTLPIPIPPNTNLARLCDIGISDSDIAWPIFQALWSELNISGRPPVLLTLDGLSYVMQNTRYRDTDNNPIHAHDMAIVKHFMDHLSGDSKMKNGGAVVVATSRSHHPISLSMELAIAQSLDRQEKRAVTQKDPFERKYDTRAETALQSASVMNLGGLSKEEARGLMEYWAASGVLRQRVDQQSVTEKWALAGNGIVGEIQRGALRMRI